MSGTGHRSLKFPSDDTEQENSGGMRMIYGSQWWILTSTFSSTTSNAGCAERLRLGYSPTLYPSPLVLSASYYTRARGHRCPHLVAFVACCGAHCDPPPSSDVHSFEELKSRFHPPTASHPLPLRLDLTFRLRVYTILDFAARTHDFLHLCSYPSKYILYFVLTSVRHLV